MSWPSWDALICGVTGDWVCFEFKGCWGNSPYVTVCFHLLCICLEISRIKLDLSTLPCFTSWKWRPELQPSNGQIMVAYGFAQKWWSHIVKLCEVYIVYPCFKYFWTVRRPQPRTSPAMAVQARRLFIRESKKASVSSSNALKMSCKNTQQSGMTPMINIDWFKKKCCC